MDRNTKRRRELILSKLWIARVSQADIARKTGVTRGLVCHVIAGRRSHAGVRQELAQAVGMDPSELWED